MAVKKLGVKDHPHSGWLGFCRQRRQKTGARGALIVENNAVKPGAKHPVWKTQTSARLPNIDFLRCRAY